MTSRPAKKLALVPPLPTARRTGEDAPVVKATFVAKPLPPAQARAAWERLVIALRRATRER